MRKPMIAGNWKLHLTIPEAQELASSLKSRVGDVAGPEVVVAPVYTALSAVAQALEGSSIAVAAQNVFWEEQGAFTGEVSAPLLKDAGCRYVIIGHSERRQYFGETDATVNRRVKSALASGLIPIVCVGETLAEREEGRARDVVKAQLLGGLEGFDGEEVSDMVMAYEPVWAIGTGRTATPEQANEIHTFIRGLLSETFDDIVSARVRILYGGSVKPENADELMAQSDIDGALVGGASLKADSFEGIIRFGGE